MIDHLLAGRYRLGDVLGRGGMASVYRAEDTLLGRHVAVKLLNPELLADHELVLRFERAAPPSSRRPRRPARRRPGVRACARGNPPRRQAAESAARSPRSTQGHRLR